MATQFPDTTHYGHELDLRKSITGEAVNITGGLWMN
jgi:hypothetical protein